MFHKTTQKGCFDDDKIITIPIMIITIMVMMIMINNNYVNNNDDKMIVVLILTMIMMMMVMMALIKRRRIVVIMMIIWGWVPVFLPVFHPRTGILHQYTGVHNVAVICSLSLLISYIKGHSQEFDFYARFRGFLVALPRAYWQER